MEFIFYKLRGYTLFFMVLTLAHELIIRGAASSKSNAHFIGGKRP